MKNQLMWALMGLIFLFRSNASAGQAAPYSEDRFFADLNGIQPSASVGTIHKVNWSADPKPTRDYSVEDAASNPNSQTVVHSEDHLYFVDQGYIFEKDITTGQVTYLKESSKVAGILIYKRILVALRKSGTIFVLSPSKKWVDIGTSAKRLLATESDLVVLTNNGQLWVYEGHPGPINISFLPIPIRVGKTIMIMPMPFANGHKIAFWDSGIDGVTTIDPAANGDITVSFQDHTALYSQLKPN